MRVIKVFVTNKFQVNLDPRFRHFLKTEKPLGMIRLFSDDSYRIFSKELFTLKQKSSGISIQWASI